MRRRDYIVVGLFFALGLFCLLYPIYVIRPFRHQGVGELALALHIMRWRETLTLPGSIGILAVLLWRWPAIPKTRRIAVGVLMLLLIAFPILSRVNIYEQMFHPLGEPAFLPIAKTHLAPDEKVVSVALNGTAHAYPIRNISYHHIVNDRLGGVPIVATY